MRAFFLLLLLSLWACQDNAQVLFQTQSGFFEQKIASNFSQPLKLQGEWLATMDSQILTGLKNAKSLSSQQVPGGWGYQGRPMESGITYLYAQVHLNNADGLWALDLPTIFCAYRLYANGELIREQGKVSQSGTLPYREAVYPALAFFPWRGESTEFILEVENLTTPYGGIQGNVTLSPMDVGIKNRDVRVIENFFLAGTYLLIAIFHFFQFYFQRKRRVYLYFGAFALMATIRTLLTEQKILTWILNIPFELQYDLEYLTVVCLAGFLSLYIKSLFPLQWPQKVARPFLWVNAVYVVFLIFLNNYQFVKIFDFYALVLIPLILVNLYALIRAIKEKAPGSLLLFVSILVLAVVGVSDLFYSLGWHSLGHNLNISLLGFLLIQFYLLASQSAVEKEKVQKASNELDLRTIQQDIFISNTTHELKTPLHGVNGMAEALGESPGLSDSFIEILPKIRQVTKSVDEELDKLIISVATDK